MSWVKDATYYDMQMNLVNISCVSQVDVSSEYDCRSLCLCTAVGTPANARFSRMYVANATQAHLITMFISTSTPAHRELAASDAENSLLQRATSCVCDIRISVTPYHTFVSENHDALHAFPSDGS